MTSPPAMPAVVVPEGVRGTPEYEAAWDLEVWKVEERRKFEKRLERERVTLGRKVDEEIAKREQQRLEAFERQKDQVHQLSLRVSRTLESLQEREDRLAAKEAELTRKRSQLVLEHESKVREAEERVRQEAERTFFNTEALNAKAKELQEENTLMQGRVDRLQRDYDRLCTEYAEYKRDHVLGGEATRLTLELREAQQTLGKAESERDDLLEKYQTERASSLRYRNKIKHLASEYNKLLSVAQRQQIEAIESERHSVRRAQAMQEASMLRQMEREAALFSATQQHLSQAPQGPQGGVAQGGGGEASQHAVADPFAFTPQLQSGEELKRLLAEAEMVEREAALSEQQQQPRASRRAASGSSARRPQRDGGASSGSPLCSTPAADDVCVSSSPGTTPATRRGAGGGGGGGEHSTFALGGALGSAGVLYGGGGGGDVSSVDGGPPGTPPGGGGGDPFLRSPVSAGSPSPGVPALLRGDLAEALKREVANRRRLLATGVMSAEDSYITQLSLCIAEKCRALGLDEKDFEAEGS